MTARMPFTRTKHPSRVRTLVFVFMAGLLVLEQLPAQVRIAPAFTLSTFDHERRSLRDLMGSRMTLVAFWSTWGKDSGSLLHDLHAMEEKYGSQGLAIVGICVDSQTIEPAAIDSLRKTLAFHGVVFPALLDSALTTFRAYDVVAVPTVVALDPSGKILRRFAGYGIMAKDALTDFVDVTIAGHRPVVDRPRRTHEPVREALLAYNMALKDQRRGRLDGARLQAMKAVALDSLYGDPLVLLAEIAWEQEDSTALAVAVAHITRIDSANSAGVKFTALLSPWISSQPPMNAADTAMGTLEICVDADRISRRGEHVRALELLNFASKRVPEDMRIHMVLARIFQRLGRTVEAEVELRKLRSLRRR